LLKYTYYGDANLDGKIDGSDYSKIDSGYLTGATGWGNGDFNYDNVINGSDYTLIDNAFNSQGMHLSAAVVDPTVQIAAEIAPAGEPAVGGVSADFGELSRAVPEPTMLGLLGIATIGLLGRRRK